MASSACCVASSASSMSRRILCATAWSRSPTATARLAKASSSPCCARVTRSVSMPLPFGPGSTRAGPSHGMGALVEIRTQSSPGRQGVGLPTDGDLAGDRLDPRRSRLLRTTDRSRSHGSDPQCRAPHSELEEPSGLGVHRCAGPRRAAAAREGGPLRRPSGSCARSDCPRPAGRDERAPAAHLSVGPRPRGAEHGARGVGARNRERAGHGLRPRARFAAPWPSQTTSAATSCSPSAIRPTPRSSARPTGPAAADRSARSSTRTPGSARRPRKRPGAPCGAPGLGFGR